MSGNGSGPVEWVKGKAVGSGSYGSVHLGLNKATGSLFAIKSAGSEAGLQCLENEADILESLDSPHIVKCIGKEKEICGGEEKKLMNLFMEYMAGGSLADVTEQFGGKLEETLVRLYTREILLGLEYLHENGIVHCDLKCKNVLLGSSGEVKLADFGCSKRRTTTNRLAPSAVVGSPLWMAPETLRNQGVDFASDIWSLGCTVIEMATGKVPWYGKISNPVDAVFKITCSEERPDFPPHFSEEGLDFLDKCLVRDPRKRWKAEELLRHPFVLQKPKTNFVAGDECASSPASVLDKDIFPETDCSDEDEMPFRTPFSMLCEKKPVGLSVSDKSNRSEEWITVR